MAKLKVSILNSTTLRLEERGEVGDIIDLRALQSVDNSEIVHAIEQAKDDVYKNLLAKEVERQNNLKKLDLLEKDKAFELRLNALSKEKAVIENQLSQVNKSLEEAKRIAVLEVENKKNQELNLKIGEKEKEILGLKNQIAAINDRQQLLITNEKNEIKNRFELEVSKKEQEALKLKSEIEQLKAREREEVLKRENEIRLLADQIKNKEAILKLEFDKKTNEITTKFKDDLALKELELSQLKYAKSNLQVKMLGEELERWCNSEYEQFSLSGFDDCKWYKDNIAIKDNPDEKGTKADYIFEVYTDSVKKDTKLLTVVCEMKNESPETKTKTKNSDHYKKLNDDRIKKNAQYALLISELEWDTVNDAPIKKINDYPNMYVVRPTYFISFLSLIKSLAKKYQDLLLEQKIASETFKESQALIEEFESFKNTYLDKPLENLLKDVEKIKNEAQKSYEASYKIVGLADTIISNKIAEIKVKIERFDIRKIARKLDNINQANQAE